MFSSLCPFCARRSLIDDEIDDGNGYAAICDGSIGSDWVGGGGYTKGERQRRRYLPRAHSHSSISQGCNNICWLTNCVYYNTMKGRHCQSNQLFLHNRILQSHSGKQNCSSSFIPHAFHITSGFDSMWIFKIFWLFVVWSTTRTSLGK